MKAMKTTILLACWVALAAALSGGCSKDEPESDAPVTKPAEPPARYVLVFPKEMEVEDESVNAFVRKVMKVSTAGDYDDFRLLWSARQQPLARSEFEKGWNAVKEIRVLALEKVALADESGGGGEPETVYALYADVQLDPEQLGGVRAASGKPEDTHRKPILMFVREHGEWRIGRAPKRMCAWLKNKVEPDNDEPKTAAPSDARSESETASQGNAPGGAGAPNGT